MAKLQGCIEVRYQIEDGYVGGARPQSFMLCEEDLFDGALDPTEEGVIDMLHDLVDNDMANKVSGSLRNKDAVVSWAMALIEERMK